MIYTLTPNPSIDRTLTIPEIQFNSVLRSKSVRLDWGGKGFNVSRALAQFGIESTAMAWVGGGTGKKNPNIGKGGRQAPSPIGTLARYMSDERRQGVK